MAILNNLWIITSLLIIGIILATDPKSSTRGSNNLTMLFSSVSESQQFVRNLTWALISTFYILTLYTNK
jgi:protein translocase SecG subunit